MRSLRSVRLLPMLALAGVLLAGSAPAMAAPAGSGTTWYVGPGGPVGRTAPAQAVGGSCDAPDFGRIGDAVDASGPGDTIVVCDGTYQELVRIEGTAHNGLTLRGETPWGATIRAPWAGRFDDLVTVDGAHGVTVANLRLLARETCGSPIGTGILVLGSTGVDIRSNRILGGAGSIANGCGLFAGIDLERSTGSVRWNRVETARELGIAAELGQLQDGTVRIIGNAVRFAPSTLPAYEPRFGIQAGTPGPDGRFIVSRNVVTVDPSIKGRAKRPTVTFGILVAGSHQLVEGNRSTGSGLALLLNGLGSDIVARDNRARGLITDCFGDVSQVWTNNNGRPWRSEPADICSLTATP